LVFYLEYSWFGKQVNFAKILVILLEEKLTGFKDKLNHLHRRKRNDLSSRILKLLEENVTFIFFGLRLNKSDRGEYDQRPETKR
jgi:hypothetical protein